MPGVEERNDIDWKNVNTRLLIGASEVVNGLETVFDSDVNKGCNTKIRECGPIPKTRPVTGASNCRSAWRVSPRQAHFLLFAKPQRIGSGHYWDGLYSQNPPVREFIAGPEQADIPERTLDRAHQPPAMAVCTRLQQGH